MGTGTAITRRRWPIRFSLATLLLLVLQITSALALWQNWSPWVCTKKWVEREIDYQPDAQRFLTISDRTTAGVGELKNETQSLVIDTGTSGFRGTIPSPDGRLILTVDVCPTLRVWDVATGRNISTMRKEQAAPVLVWSAEQQTSFDHAAFSPDSRSVLAVNNRDLTVRVWDTETGAERAVLKGHQKYILSPCFSKSGDMIATVSFDGTVRVWDAVTGKQLKLLTSRLGKIDFWSVAFSPDDRWLLATGCQTAHLWSTQTGEEVGVLQVHCGGGWIEALFTPDGRRVIAAGGTFFYGTHDGSSNRELLATGKVGCVKIWDAETWNVSGEGHSLEEIRDVLLTPDGERIVTAGSTVTVWSAHSAKKLATLGGHRVDSIESGDCIVTSDYGGTNQIWQRRRQEAWWRVLLLPELWLTLLCASALAWSLWRDKKNQLHLGKTLR